MVRNWMPSGIRFMESLDVAALRIGTKASPRPVERTARIVASSSRGMSTVMRVIISVAAPSTARPVTIVGRIPQVRLSLLASATAVTKTSACGIITMPASIADRPCTDFRNVGMKLRTVLSWMPTTAVSTMPTLNVASLNMAMFSSGCSVCRSTITNRTAASIETVNRITIG